VIDLISSIRCAGGNSYHSAMNLRLKP